MLRLLLVIARPAALLLLGVGLLAARPAGAVTIEEVKSPSGVTAWLVVDHSLPVVTLDVSFRGGAVLDPRDKDGLATLTADLLDEGAGSLDSAAFQGQLEDLATTLEFEAGQDGIGGTLRTITANVEPAFALLHLALTAPRFDDDAVHRVRGQLTAELARERREPHHIAGRLWWRSAFGDRPYARPTKGTPETLARIAPEDMRALVRDRFAKDTILIGVVGDITPDALTALLDKTFGDLPAHAREATLPEEKAVTKDDLALARLPIPQSVVSFGQPGIKRNDPDWYAAYIVNHILGDGGFTSRLTTEVREKRGLAYSVASTLVPLQHSAVILGSVATENSRVAESIDIIREEWRRMRDAGPTAKELADAKTYLTGSYPLSLDSTGALAATLVAVQRDGLGIDYLDKRKAYIERVTLEDAKRVAHRLLDPDHLSFVVVGSPEALAGAHEVAPSVD